MSIDPAALPDDIDALKHIIGELARDAVAARAEIEKLRFQLARFKRAQFGRSSEKIEHIIEQRELAIETLDEDHAQRIAAIPAVAAAIGATSEQTAKPARRPLPEHLPREEIVHPGACSCPNCGGTLRRIGADVTETLDYVPGRFKVVRHVREAFSCRFCETVVQTPAPNHTIARGRQARASRTSSSPSSTTICRSTAKLRFMPGRRRSGDLDAIRLGWGDGGGWRRCRDAAARDVGFDVLRRHPGPGSRPGAGKTKTGRLWTYVRDERPHRVRSRRPLCSSIRRIAKASIRSRICRTSLVCSMPTAMPGSTASTKAAALSKPPAGRTCGGSFLMFTRPTARRSPRRRSIGSAPSTVSRRPSTACRLTNGVGCARRNQSRLPTLSRPGRKRLRRSSRADRSSPSAFRYMLARWLALTQCFDDGRLSLDNNPAERALCGVAIGRKNYLFAGSDRGGERAAAMYSLIETAKLNGIDPEAYLRDVLARIADHPKSPHRTPAMELSVASAGR